MRCDAVFEQNDDDIAVARHISAHGPFDLRALSRRIEREAAGVFGFIDRALQG